jgi:hypothetical protein
LKAYPTSYFIGADGKWWQPTGWSGEQCFLKGWRKANPINEDEYE